MLSHSEYAIIQDHSPYTVIAEKVLGSEITDAMRCLEGWFSEEVYSDPISICSIDIAVHALCIAKRRSPIDMPPHRREYGHQKKYLGYLAISPADVRLFMEYQDWVCTKLGIREYLHKQSYGISPARIYE